MLAAIERGEIQRAILDSAYEIDKGIESGDRVVVGKNRFVSEIGDEDVPIQDIDPDVARRQIARLQRVRQERDGEEVQRALSRLRAAAVDAENTMPYILDAVSQRATVGEIMGVFKEVFGTYKEPVII
jgi:methylmalonyl-CoA mutase N-terminal domain/subunit